MQICRFYSLTLERFGFELCQICSRAHVLVCVCGNVLERVDKALNEKLLKQNCRLYTDNTRKNSARCSASAELPCRTVAVWYCCFHVTLSVKCQAFLFVAVRDVVTGRSVSFCIFRETKTMTIVVVYFCLTLSVSVCSPACLPAAWFPLQLLNWMADCLWNLRTKFIHFNLFPCAINEAVLTVPDGVCIRVSSIPFRITRRHVVGCVLNEFILLTVPCFVS